METNNVQYTDARISSAFSDILVKQRCAKSVMCSLMILIASVICIITGASLFETTSAIYLTLMTLGVTGIIVALAKMIFSDKKMVYSPTKSPIKHFSIFFNAESLSKLINAIEGGKSELMYDIIADNRSAGVRLDVAMSKDNQFAACQVFKYIPYSFEAFSDVYQIEELKLNDFCNSIKELSIKQ